MHTVNVNYLGSKVKTKNEIYHLLTVECKLYLPPQKECSIYFKRDILHGKKMVMTLNHNLMCRLCILRM